MNKRVLLMVSVTIFSRLLAAQTPDITNLVGDNWYGMYMNGQKVGWNLNSIKKDDKNRVHVVEDARFYVNMSGAKQDMHVFTDRIYAGEDGHLIEIVSEVTDPSQISRFHALAQGDSLLLTSVMGQNTTEKSLPSTAESLKDSVCHAQWARQAPQVGDAVNFTVFEPLYQQDVAGISRIVDVEDRVFNGVTTKTYKIRTVLDVMGVDSFIYVTDAGVTVEEQWAGNITLRLEPEQVAKDVTYNNDVIVSNAALVNTPIDNPRERPSLRLALKGPLNEGLMLNDDRQRMRRGDGEVLFQSRLVSLDGFTSAKIPVTEGDAAQWVKASQFIQSDHPKMLAKAKEIVGEETDALVINKKLCEWVYKSMHTRYSARLSNSLEALESLEGDCTEHSVLFVGLARAAGLPAREVAGLIYIGGAQPGFYFHQWAMVWIGKWVDVDPTFNQPVADVTHIKLTEGDLIRQTRIIPVIGKLQVAVLPDGGEDLFAAPAPAEKPAAETKPAPAEGEKTPPPAATP